MSCVILLQSTVGSVSFYLELSADGSPATGLTFSDVTADLKKEGGSFTSFTLTALNFTELGSGFYEIDLSATDTDTLGNLYLRISGATINTALVTAYIAASVPVNPITTPTVPTTTIYGYITNPDGSAVYGASISARILAVPSVYHPSTEAVVVDSGLVTVKTDSGGFFTMELITGSVVDIYISSAGYRRTLTVPATSQNLFSIP